MRIFFVVVNLKILICFICWRDERENCIRELNYLVILLDLEQKILFTIEKTEAKKKLNK